MNRWKLGTGAVGAAAIVAATAGGCGSSTTAGTGAGTSSSHGSTSNAASTSGATSTGSASSGSASASTSSSGAGGAGSSSSSSGAGGSAVTCLPTTSFASAFAIMDSSFCPVAIYTADEALSAGASWGSHHGPLTMVTDASGGGATLERWTAPSGTSGALTKQATHVALGVPTGAYLNPIANDMPFFGWTIVSWTGPSPATTGSLAAIAGGAVAQTYAGNGFYSAAGISDGAGQGRLLFAGLAPLGMPSTDTNGIYEADACAAPMQELGAGTGCSASAVVSAYDEYSGPIALDKNDNAFAVLTDASTAMQTARGFLAKNIARGASATPGVQVFQIGGFGGSFVAITPTATKPGLLVFQPFDATTYDALDVIEQAYTVGSDVAPMGTTSTLFSVPAGGSTGLTFMTDDGDRLWVGYSDTATTAQWVVLARTP